MAHSEMIGKNDLEKQASSENLSEKAQLPSYGLDEQMRRGSVTSYHEGFFGAFKLDSFKRNPNARVVTEATDSEGRPLEDQPPAEPALAMKLKERHLQMIAIGGSIGTSHI
jgi:amino acid transporter